MAKNTQPDKQSNKLLNFTCVVICAVMIIAFALFIGNQSASYNSLRTRYDYIARQYADARGEFYALSYQIAHFDSDAYVERLARERLGWARPNEIIFRQRTH